jgi:hypothetical protein
MKPQHTPGIFPELCCNTQSIVMLQICGAVYDQSSKHKFPIEGYWLILAYDHLVRLINGALLSG